MNKPQHFITSNWQKWLPTISAIKSTFRLNNVVKCLSQSINCVNNEWDETLLLVTFLQVFIASTFSGVAPIDFTFVTLLPELVEPDITTIHIRLIWLVACWWTLIWIELGLEREKVIVKPCGEEKSLMGESVKGENWLNQGLLLKSCFLHACIESSFINHPTTKFNDPRRVKKDLFSVFVKHHSPKDSFRWGKTVIVLTAANSWSLTG